MQLQSPHNNSNLPTSNYPNNNTDNNAAATVTKNYDQQITEANSTNKQKTSTVFNMDSPAKNPTTKLLTKSVAQRVMEVTSSNRNNNSQPDKSPIKSSFKSADTRSLLDEIQELTRTANSLGIDSNNMINGLNIVEGSPSNSSTHLSDPDNPSGYPNSGSVSTDSESPKLSNADSSMNVKIENSSSIKHSKVLANNYVNKSIGDSIPRQFVRPNRPDSSEDDCSSKPCNSLRTESSGSSVDDKELNISLDTKVPHPSSSKFESASTSVRDEQGKDDHLHDEVSYCNDQVVSNLVNSNDKQKIKLTSFDSKVQSIPQDFEKIHRSTHSHNEMSEVKKNNEVDVNYMNACIVEENYESTVQYYNAFAGNHEPSSSPKAKSAPVTPCNSTPPMFHQGVSQFARLMNPNPANTLPPDISRSIAASYRIVPTGPHRAEQVSVQIEELFKEGNRALRANKLQEAINYFDQLLELTNRNRFKHDFRVYGLRAEAHFMSGKYKEALEDSVTARQLNPRWTDAYYYQAMSCIGLGEHDDALGALAYGLTQTSKGSNEKLFQTLVESALKLEEFKVAFEPKYNKLKSLGLHVVQFVVVATLGQELLALGRTEHAAMILECSLGLADCCEFRKLQASVLASLAFAYCSPVLSSNYNKAIGYLQRELEIEEELQDVEAQSRVLANIGFTYYKMRNLDKALHTHRMEVSLALRARLFKSTARAFNALGHVHSARGDFQDALTSHTKCLELLKQLGDFGFTRFRELLAIGHVYMMLKDLGAAENVHQQADQLLESIRLSERIEPDQHKTALVMLNFSQGHLSLRKQDYSEARHHYQLVVDVSSGMIDQTRRQVHEMRAQMALGHICRLTKMLEEARGHFHRQLALAEKLSDKIAKSQALCNLAITYHHLKDNTEVWRLLEDNLHLVEGLNPILRAYAHSYLGSIQFLANDYQRAQSNYVSSQNLFRDLAHCKTERRTLELNLEAIQERLNMAAEASPVQTCSRSTNTPTTMTNQQQQQTAHQSRKIAVPLEVNN